MFTLKTIFYLFFLGFLTFWTGRIIYREEQGYGAKRPKTHSHPAVDCGLDPKF
jgi:hypothetical protein